VAVRPPPRADLNLDEEPSLLMGASTDDDDDDQALRNRTARMTAQPSENYERTQLYDDEELMLASDSEQKPASEQDGDVAACDVCCEPTQADDAFLDPHENGSEARQQSPIPQELAGQANAEQDAEPNVRAPRPSPALQSSSSSSLFPSSPSSSFPSATNSSVEEASSTVGAPTDTLSKATCCDEDMDTDPEPEAEPAARCQPLAPTPASNASVWQVLLGGKLATPSTAQSAAGNASRSQPSPLDSDREHSVTDDSHASWIQVPDDVSEKSNISASSSKSSTTNSSIDTTSSSSSSSSSSTVSRSSPAASPTVSDAPSTSTTDPKAAHKRKAATVAVDPTDPPPETPESVPEESPPRGGRPTRGTRKRVKFATVEEAPAKKDPLTTATDEEKETEPATDASAVSSTQEGQPVAMDEDASEDAAVEDATPSAAELAKLARRASSRSTLAKRKQPASAAKDSSQPKPEESTASPSPKKRPTRSRSTRAAKLAAEELAAAEPDAVSEAESLAQPPPERPVAERKTLARGTAKKVAIQQNDEVNAEEVEEKHDDELSSASHSSTRTTRRRNVSVSSTSTTDKRTPRRRTNMREDVGEEANSADASAPKKKKKKKTSRRAKESSRQEEESCDEAMIDAAEVVEEDLTPPPAASNSSSAEGEDLLDDEGPSAHVARRVQEQGPVRVIFTGLTKIQTQRQEQQVKNMGGEIVSDILAATHLVTDKVRRTVKFLAALNRGIHIVSPKWITASSRERTWTDPSKYLVSDSVNEKEYKFKLKNSLANAREQPLLNGVSFFVTESVRPPPSDLQTVIVAGGGQLLSSQPTARSKSPVVVISCAEDQAQSAKLSKAGFPSHDAELLLTGVLQQRFEPDRYLLDASSSSTSSAKPTKRTRRR